MTINTQIPLPKIYDTEISGTENLETKNNNYKNNSNNNKVSKDVQ